MKSFVIAFAALASLGSFAATADLSLSTTSHKLEDAEYKLVPTRTETREIPNCSMEANYPCTMEVVLESKPVIAVNVSYQDIMFRQEGHLKEWLTLYFDVADFDAADVEALKAVYPTWRHLFTRVPSKWAKRLLTMTVKKAARTIQVVDVRNSHLCRILESGEQEVGCVENIVYKPATTWVKEVTVTKK